VVRTAYEPVVGSLLLAYDALGISTSPALLERLTASLPGAEFFATTRLSQAPAELLAWRPANEPQDEGHT
jgi:hypothetical protein